MTPAESSRSPRTARQRRPLGAFVVVVTLCIIAFALGVFLGKSQQSAPEKNVVVTPAVTPVIHPVALQPAVPVVAEPLAQSPMVNSGAGLAPVPTNEQSVEQVLHASAGAVKVADELSARSLADADQSPLGNGINSNAVVVETPSAVVTALQVKPATVITPPVVATKVAVVVKRAPAAVLHKSAYVVQVGSFKNRSDAARVQKKVGAGFPVNINRADLGKKGVWFRVVVGPVATADEASKLQARLHENYKLSGFVKKMTL